MSEAALPSFMAARRATHIVMFRPAQSLLYLQRMTARWCDTEILPRASFFRSYRSVPMPRAIKLCPIPREAHQGYDDGAAKNVVQGARNTTDGRMASERGPNCDVHGLSS
jgi:hypothetical protein